MKINNEKSFNILMIGILSDDFGQAFFTNSIEDYQVTIVKFDNKWHLTILNLETGAEITDVDYDYSSFIEQIMNYFNIEE